MIKDYIINYPRVTRVEVIDQAGRVYNAYDIEYVAVSLQDDERTLKIFVNDKSKD